MSLRLLPIITDSGIGGSETVLSQILENVDRNRLDPVGVVVLKKKRERAASWEKLGLPVTALGMRRIPTPGQLLKLKHIIDSARPDVVYAFLFHPIQCARFLKALGGRFKLITSPRINYRFTSGWIRKFDRLVNRFDDGSICESQASRQLLVTELGYPPEKVVVVNNGVDVNKYVFSQENRMKLRQQWGVREGEILIGGVGRFHPQKGFDLLIRSLASLKTGPVPFKLVLVGEGGLENQLRELAKNYSIEALFPGLRSDMPSVYSALDIFVQSSRYEGLSNALLEAMAVGRPCVATAVDGTMDIAQDGTNMVLVKPDDVASLSVGVGLLLEKAALREALSRGARTTAQEFSQQKMIRGFEDATIKFVHDPNSR